MTEDVKMVALKVRLAEEAERYDDMVRFVNKLIKTSPDGHVDPSVITQLTVAYKNAVGERRASWRSLLTFVDVHDEDEEAMVQCYQESVGEEILVYCSQMMELLDQHLMSKFPSGANNVILLKLKGDHLRYMAEVQSDDEKEESTREADATYSEAIAQGRKYLVACDPVLLELALNHSVLKFDMMNQHREACEIAKQAFENAMQVVDKEEGERYISSSATMQILRDNLVQWTLSTEDSKGD